jgi:manganese/zinc/iron transport system ATP- binding protein
VTNDPLLTVDHVGVAYRGVDALIDVSFSARAGELVGVVGPNGAGKSTLLKAILGLLPFTGSVALDGRAMAEARDLTAYVPQRASVDWDFPATALDVVLQGMVRETGWLRPYGRARRERALAHLETVGLADLAQRQIGQMSGGQQQRVFLARGLARNARALFFDEPLAGVDAASEQIILACFDRLTAEGRLVLCVHHDLGTVAGRFDSVVVLNKRLVRAGPTDIAFTPAVIAEAYGVPLHV